MKKLSLILFVAVVAAVMFGGCGSLNTFKRFECRVVIKQDAPYMHEWGGYGRKVRPEQFRSIKRGDTLNSAFEVTSFTTGRTDYIVWYGAKKYYITSEYAESVIAPYLASQDLSFWIPKEDDMLAWSRAVAFTVEIGRSPIDFQTPLLIRTLPIASTGAPGFEITKKLYGDKWKYKIDFRGIGEKYSSLYAGKQAKKIAFLIENYDTNPCDWD